MGAIGEGGARVLEEHVLAHARVSDAELQAVEDHERAVLENRVVRFRKGRTRQDLTGRIAVIVDDGIATGSTARVACRVARKLGAARVILAVPVAPADTLSSLTEPDEVVCLATPHHFSAVGYHYRDFSPTEDDEVVQLLDAAAKRLQNSQPASRTPAAAARQDARGDRRGSRDPVARGAAPGPAAPAGPGPGRGAVRARQRQQPAQPAEPVRGRGPPAGRPRHPAAGPADPGGGTKPRQRLRHRTAGPPAVLGHGLARHPAGYGLLHGWLFRGQHRCRRRALGRLRTNRQDRRRRLPRRPPRSGRAAGCPPSGRRRSSSWAATTTRCWSSTARRSP